MHARHLSPWLVGHRYLYLSLLVGVDLRLSLRVFGSFSGLPRGYCSIPENIKYVAYSLGVLLLMVGVLHCYAVLMMPEADQLLTNHGGVFRYLACSPCAPQRLRRRCKPLRTVSSYAGPVQKGTSLRLASHWQSRSIYLHLSLHFVRGPQGLMAVVPSVVICPSDATHVRHCRSCAALWMPSPSGVPRSTRSFQTSFQTAVQQSPQTWRGSIRASRQKLLQLTLNVHSLAGP
jgi:hypothetical protein